MAMPAGAAAMQRHLGRRSADSSMSSTPVLEGSLGTAVSVSSDSLQRTLSSLSLSSEDLTMSQVGVLLVVLLACTAVLLPACAVPVLAGLTSRPATPRPALGRLLCASHTSFPLLPKPPAESPFTPSHSPLPVLQVVALQHVAAGGGWPMQAHTHHHLSLLGGCSGHGAGLGGMLMPDVAAVHAAVQAAAVQHHLAMMQVGAGPGWAVLSGSALCCGPLVVLPAAQFTSSKALTLAHPTLLPAGRH